MSNFSFSHCVFYPLFILEGYKICCLGTGLAKVTSFRSVMFPGVCPCFLTTALTQPSFQWPDYFPQMLNKGERWKYAGKKVCLNRVWNSQPPGHEFDMLTTEPSWWGTRVLEFNAVSLYGKKSSGSSYISIFSALIQKCNCMVNPLQDDKILDWSKLKQIADNILKVHLKWKVSTI